MTTINMILCTCPDREKAEEIAESLVEAKLAACVNILPGITSVYRWQDAIQKDAEVLLLIKTAAKRSADLQQALIELHPYEVPEVIILPVEGGHLPYIEWVEQCTISS